jgi:hypothetical protein
MGNPYIELTKQDVKAVATSMIYLGQRLKTDLYFLLIVQLTHVTSYRNQPNA